MTAGRWTITGTNPEAEAEADTAIGHTWQLFTQQYDWPGVDGHNGPISVVVTRHGDHRNAWWTPCTITLADTDGETFHSFTRPMTVLAHEYGHGVLDHTVRLATDGETGALGEHLADVFAALTEQHAHGQTAGQASWLIGEGIYLPRVHGRALRSMLEPGSAFADPVLGRDSQPGHMAELVPGGDVHVNSGPANRAFVTAAVAVGGWAWETVGRVWWETIRSGQVGRRCGLGEFADLTGDVAAELFPGGVVADQVRSAWADVGVAD